MTGQWKTLAAQQVTRQYHSTALLLPDGRVLSAGGGICGTCDQVQYLAKNAEVFTPPYLFKQDGSGELAPRPAITAAPADAAYATPFQISTPQAASINKVGLVRLGAVTHSVDMEQRYVPLNFTRGSGTVTVTAPRDANVAPPGMYMLFAIDANGVPSAASMVTLKDTASPTTVSLSQPAGGATFTAPATISIAANATDADGIAKVEFYSGTAKLGEDTTAPYTHTWTNVQAGSYTLTARASDNLGATATSAARTISVVAPNSPPSASITSPVNGAAFSWHPTINITATASDPDGTVQKVEFFRSDGTVKLGEDTSAPFAFRWKNAPSGAHQLRVKPTDNRGAVTTSAAVGITVRVK